MKHLLRTHLLLVAALGLMAFTAPVQADYRDKYDYNEDIGPRYWNSSYRADKRPTYAKVVKVEPIVGHYQRSIPQQHCWDERVRYRTGGYISTTPSIVGGIIGAAVGHELGRDSNSHNRRWKVLAGSLLGASIGNDIGRRNSREGDAYQDRVERLCQTDHQIVTEERVDGYHVTYRYRGKTYRTRMDYDPGKRIEVDVRVRPVF